MEEKKLYALPELEYGYNELEPYLSEELVRLHHDKHHAAYVKGANDIFMKMENSRIEEMDFDTKSTFKELSFHIGGQLLHSFYWKNIAPSGKGGGGEPTGMIADVFRDEYGSIARFKKIFSQTAMSVEGSGWAAVAFCKVLNRPMIMQIEKHNVNVIPAFKILLVLDVWEHAYYVDYKNDRGKYVEAFWNIINWEDVNKRLDYLLKH